MPFKSKYDMMGICLSIIQRNLESANIVIRKPLETYIGEEIKGIIGRVALQNV